MPNRRVGPFCEAFKKGLRKSSSEEVSSYGLSLLESLCFLADSISSRGIFALLLFKCITEVSVNAMTLNFVQEVLSFSVGGWPTTVM